MGSQNRGQGVEQIHAVSREADAIEEEVREGDGEREFAAKTQGQQRRKSLRRKWSICRMARLGGGRLGGLGQADENRAKRDGSDGDARGLREGSCDFGRGARLVVLGIDKADDVG